MNEDNMKKYIESKKYLPKNMLDEEEVSKFFSSLQPLIDKTPMLKITTSEAKDFIMNHFLPLLAEYGYTLQKNRAKQNFLSDTVKTIDKQLAAYMNNESQKYLPEFLQDFHDQKLFFKFLNSEHVKEGSWVNQHIFTIDIFLYVIGYNGDKLQKTRSSKLQFKQLYNDLNEFDNRQRSMFASYIGEMLNKNKEEKGSGE